MKKQTIKFAHIFNLLSTYYVIPIAALQTKYFKNDYQAPDAVLRTAPETAASAKSLTNYRDVDGKWHKEFG